MKIVLLIGVSMLIMTLVLLSANMWTNGVEFLRMGYLIAIAIAFMLSLTLTIVSVVIYMMIRKWVSQYKKKSGLSCGDLNEVRVESRYLIYTFFVACIATVINLYQLF
jgi:membrane protein implicated in regulation of membrane protease activity